MPICKSCGNQFANSVVRDDGVRKYYNRRSYCLDCHIPNNEKYTKEILESVVQSSTSIAQVLHKLNLKLAGGNYSNISRKIKKYSIDISHFTGQGHNKGKRSPKKKLAKEFLVLGKETDRRQTAELLRRSLIESGIDYVCSDCGSLPEWKGIPLVLTIDHKNGNFWDNRKENLRFLCPNCHSQTHNFGRKKK